MFFIASIASLVVAFIPAKGSMKTLRVVFGMVGKFFATGTLESLNCWTSEIFPVDVRSRGMGFVQVGSEYFFLYHNKPNLKNKPQLVTKYLYEKLQLVALN